jgi:hypothetical protein
MCYAEHTKLWANDTIKRVRSPRICTFTTIDVNKGKLTIPKDPNSAPHPRTIQRTNPANPRPLPQFSILPQHNEHQQTTQSITSPPLRQTQQ